MQLATYWRSNEPHHFMTPSLALGQLIENQEINEFIRGAALKSLVVLVVQEIIPREQVIQYFEKLFSTLGANKPSTTDLEYEPEYIWTDLVINSSILCPVELKEYIERTFDEDSIEPFSFTRDDFNDYLQAGSEANLNELREERHYSLVEDTVSYMKNWACFEENQPRKISNILTAIEGFSSSTTKKAAKSKAKKKKKMQKESRRKNRPKKK